MKCHGWKCTNIPLFIKKTSYQLSPITKEIPKSSQDWHTFTCTCIHTFPHSGAYPGLQLLLPVCAKALRYYPLSQFKNWITTVGKRWSLAFLLTSSFKKKGKCDVAEIHWGVWMLGLFRTDYKLQLILLCVFSRGWKKTVNGFQEIIFITKW